MELKDSATRSGPVAFALGRALRTAVSRLAQGWHDTVYLHARLLDWQRPWEHQGPLRWRREIGGTRLLGSRLPAMDR